jgi:hypothetical protein
MVQEGNMYLSETDRQYITGAFSRGISLRMLAKEYGIDHNTLSKACKSVGISVPTKADSAKHTWSNHKHPHIGKRGADSYAYGRKQSREDVEKRIAKISGPNNYHWSGGRKKHSAGYIVAYAPDHPWADRQGFVLEHRLVIEKHIGRILHPDEVVHHINGDKTDNRLENLTLLTMSSHSKLHQELRRHQCLIK